MPSRIVREGIINSPRVNGLTLGAEVLYRRLMSIADDYGRYHGSLLTLRVACYPTNPERFREKDVKKWFNELLRGENPLIRTYIVSGITYLEIQDFGQQKRGKSKFPNPPWFKDHEDTEESAKQAISIDDSDGLAAATSNAQGIRSRSRSEYSESESYSLTRGSDEADPEPLAGASLILCSPPSEIPARRKSGRSTEEIEKALGPERLIWWKNCWAIYPEHNGKKPAMNVFERKVHDRDLAAKIYKGVQQYAAVIAADSTLKPKFFQGWLNDERWNDEHVPRDRGSPAFTPNAAQIRRSEVVAGLEELERMRKL